MTETIKATADNLNSLDWIMIALLCASIVLGYARGFVRQLLSVTGWVVAYMAANYFYLELSTVLQKTAPLAAWKDYDQYAFMVEGLRLDRYVYNAAAFALIFIGVKLALAVFARIFDLLAKLPGIDSFNKWGGVLLALGETVVIIMIAISVMNAMPAENVQRWLTDSAIVAWYMENAPTAVDWLRALWNK